MSAWWMLVGAVLSGPIWVGLTIWTTRRLWRSARRLTARAKRRERLIELGQLVGGLAHEIKNPLSTVNVNLKLLSEDLARFGDEEHRRLGIRLETVQLEADRIRETLDDFLRFAGKYELSLNQADLRKVAEELVDFFAPQADAAGTVLRSALPDTPVVCNVDVNLIKQALLNLMVNAVQVMPDGGELLIRLSADKAMATVEVIDTGPGIAAGDLEKVFEVYFSTKPQGSGLGLAITRRIVREHGGDITVESEPGKGTRFTIELPISK